MLCLPVRLILHSNSGDGLVVRESVLHLFDINSISFSAYSKELKSDSYSFSALRSARSKWNRKNFLVAASFLVTLLAMSLNEIPPL